MNILVGVESGICHSKISFISIGLNSSRDKSLSHGAFQLLSFISKSMQHLKENDIFKKILTRAGFAVSVSYSRHSDGTDVPSDNPYVAAKHPYFPHMHRFQFVLY